MRQPLFASMLLVSASTALAAQQTGWQPPAGRPTLDLWANGAPDSTLNPASEADMTTDKDNLVAGKPVVRLGNVSHPTITLYSAEEAYSGTAIVVFPGGAYRILAIDLEGTEVCDWLVAIHVNCILVKYRVPDSGPLPKSTAALQDAQRAVGIVRLHAAEWHLDPHRVGVLGFSAGAHLSAALSTHFDHRLYEAVDAVPTSPSWSTPATCPWPNKAWLSIRKFTLPQTPRHRSSFKPRTILSTLKTPPVISCS